MKKINKFSSLEAEYKLLAMRADKRLQRLEKYMQRSGYETLSKGAYARAMRDIEIWSGKGRKRFLTKAPGNVEELQAKINDIKAFLRSDTSTLKPGIDTQGYAVSVYEKQAQTFNNRYGGDFTWQELANYYGSKKADKIAKSIKASKSVARALGEFKKLMQRTPKKTRQQFRDEIKNNPDVKYTDDEVTNEIMKKMIKIGISPRTLFKGK